ncbi:MAG: hypothetical protein ACK5M3_09325 [Dysgonomonas sp.]
MKHYLLALSFFIFALQAKAQEPELPSIPANGFAFPIGSKFSIKLIPVDSVNYDYSVLSIEYFDTIVDSWKTDSLFSEKGEPNTIDFYFCYGTHGDTKEEKDKNMKVLLLMKNYTGEALMYTSEIQKEEDGEFVSTSNVGTYSGVKTTEIWPYMIYMIGLREFRKRK